LFQINGETAIFDTAGLVMSAQHRLKAIGEGTIAVPLLSVYGIDPAAFSTLDQGARRHGSDVLSLLGKEDGTFLSSALTWATRYAGDGIDRGCWYSLPNEEIPSIAEAYPTMSQSVAWAKSKKKTKLVPPGLLAFMHHALMECDAKPAADFFEKVIDGIGVQKLSWEYCLRRRLTGDLSDCRHYNDQIHIAALTFKAFNRSRSGEPVIAPLRGGKEIEPTITWRPEQNEAFPDLDPPSE
jgi:hypothetical protein